MPRQAPERALIRGGLRERVIGRQRHSGGGRGKPDERRLGGAGLCHVEARQPDRRRHDVEEAEDPLRLAGVGEDERVDQECGRDAEADDVHQAVELRPEMAAGVGEPGHAAVQRVEDPREEDVPARAIELATAGQNHGPDPEEQIEQREQARDDDHHSPHTWGAREPGPSHSPYSARTDAPARTRSPTLTRTAGRLERGKNTSTREPKRIIPMRCAWATRSPVRPSVTMRRAISPAIWRTSTGPAGPRIPTEACSLSRLAFSDAACRNFPGLRCTSSIDPESGYRFTCTSKTFMKIEMRVASVLRYIGSCTTATSTILPSAGAMINRSPRGPRRSGSRKNISSHTASANRIASGIQSHAIPRPAPHAPTPASVHPGRMNGQPSAATLIAPARALSQRLPRDQSIRLQIPRARRLHDLVGEPGWWRIAVPLALLLEPRQVVPQRLLVEARLAPPRAIAFGGPEARRVGRQDLVDHEQRPL